MLKKLLEKIIILCYNYLNYITLVLMQVLYGGKIQNELKRNKKDCNQQI